MSGKSFADDLSCLCVGNDVIKPEPDPLDFARPGVDQHGVVVVEGRMVRDTHFNDGVDVPALFNFVVAVGRIPHQRGPAQFKKAQVVGVIHELRLVRIRVEYSAFASMPYFVRGSVFYVF